MDNPQQLNSPLRFSKKKKKKDLFLIKPLQDLQMKALCKIKVSLLFTIVSITEMIKAKENNCDMHCGNKTKLSF